MAATTGSAFYLKFGSTELHADYRSFNHEETGALARATAGADANESYLTTLKDGTASVTIVYQTDDTATEDAVAVLTSGTLEWAEDGTAASNRKHTVLCIVTSRGEAVQFEDVTMMDVAWQYNGALVDTIY